MVLALSLKQTEIHPGDKPSLNSNGTNRECGKANTLKHQENRQDSNKISSKRKRIQKNTTEMKQAMTSNTLNIVKRKKCMHIFCANKLETWMK